MFPATLSYGKSVPATCRIVTLCWDSTRIGDDPDRSSLDRVGQDPGVYAIEGCRDGSPSPGVLYIGRTGHGASKNVLASRLGESLNRVWWENDNGVLRLFSDVWDVQVRWAPISDHSLIEGVERVLIASHRPAFNAQGVHVAMPGQWSDLVVLNAGKKGRLVPVAFGGYFNPELFESY